VSSVRRSEALGTFPGAAYRGTFAPSAPRPDPGAEVPPGWEGLYFPYDAALADLRPDGSPARDGVLPEIPLPRRMYAGEDTVFHRPLRYGDVVEQVVAAGDVVEKTGRSGRLVFADVVREYLVDGERAVSSTWHDVFLDVAGPGSGAGAGAGGSAASGSASGADWSEPLRLDERQLFRFSALTFNTHRVHYDARWAREEEGLDGLLVHGPLLRILLLDAAVRHEAAAPDGQGARVGAFSFRVQAPLLAGADAMLAGTRHGQQSEVHVLDTDGGQLAHAVVTWSEGTN
jgi:3-methylfumaryl-CoA hydratase